MKRGIEAHQLDWELSYVDHLKNRTQSPAPEIKNGLLDHVGSQFLI